MDLSFSSTRKDRAFQILNRITQNVVGKCSIVQGIFRRGKQSDRKHSIRFWD